MAAKERRLTAKGVLEKVCGNDVDRNHISPVDKVAIMEYLFSCPMGEVVRYNDNDLPSFIVSCALLLINSQLKEYMEVLRVCREIAKEDNFMAK